MKLKNIEISGFRGFPNTNSFDLSADATILIGANGLGKTSLLDAIHWGLCGQLPRLGDGARVVSLYSETGQAKTTLVSSSRNCKAICLANTYLSNMCSQAVNLDLGQGGDVIQDVSGWGRSIASRTDNHPDRKSKSLLFPL